jgi:hypothetical protein
MKSSLKIINLIVAIAVGVLILAGYVLPISGLLSLRVILLQWAVVLAGFALLVGIVNLLLVHWRKIQKGQSGAAYSFILILAFVASLVVFLIDKPTGRWSLWIFNNIQLPVESSLMAVLAIALVYAGMRLLRRRANLFTLIFILTVLLVFLGVPLFGTGEIVVLRDIRDALIRIWSVPGARGILFGVALGTIAAGMRVLLGADRPYGG